MVKRFLSEEKEDLGVHTRAYEVDKRHDVNVLWERFIGSRDLAEDVEVALLNEVAKHNKKLFSNAYLLYLSSKRWRRIREDILERDGWGCVVCKSTVGLHVDHLKYKAYGKNRDVFVFGNEVAEELQTLCARCHSLKTKRFDMGSWSSKAVVVNFNGDSQLYAVLRRGYNGEKRKGILQEEVVRDLVVATASAEQGEDKVA